MDGKLSEYPLSLIARAGARLMQQVTLEDGLFEALGRNQYERPQNSKGVAIKEGRSNLVVGM